LFIPNKGLSDSLGAETDPTVPASIKDGISWSEVAGIPSDLTDGDDVGLTTENDPIWIAEKSGYLSTTGGQVNVLTVLSSLAVGTGTATGQYAFAQGNDTTAGGYASHAEGSYTTASGNDSHAEGSVTTASGRRSHAEGSGTTASGIGSHAEGSNTEASGEQSHAEGKGTTASGIGSHAEGIGTTASAGSSHAEGNGTIASGGQSHAEGHETTASGTMSHAEGYKTTASGHSSHAAGWQANAIHDHTYVWSDGTSISSSSEKQYTVRAQNGIRLYGGNVYYQGSLVDESDLRLKQNIAPITSALDKVEQINGVYFQMIAQPDVTEIGVIAQEVEKVLPEVVVENPEGYKSVDYSKLTALLIEATKELKAQKDAELEALHQEITVLREQVGALRRALE